MPDRTAEHARFAPSGLGIYGPGGCPASVRLQAEQPPQEETDESREGTAAHWLLAQTLLKLPVPDGAIAPNGVPIDAEMREAIKEMVVDFNDTAAAQKGTWYYNIETRVAAPLTIHPDFWATRRLYVWDFKYGHRFVDVLRNWQLIGYALCIAETEGIADLADWVVVFTIAQPRWYGRDELGGTLRTWVANGADVAGQLFQELRAAVWAADKPDAPCSTGENCRYCTAIWDCEASRRAGGASVDLIMGAQSANMNAQAIGVELLTLNRAAERVKARLSALEEKATALIFQGQDVAFHKLENGQSRTVWDKTKIDAAALTLHVYGVDVRPGVALPTPREAMKKGIDAAVIKPYVTTTPAAKKLVAATSHGAEKTLGRR